MRRLPAEESVRNMKIDCGHCGSDDVTLTDGAYLCTQCGKSYTESEAQERERQLELLNRKRRIILYLLTVSALFLIASALLLPGYAEDGSRAGLLYAAVAACLAAFIAAIAARFSFGKARKQLYSD